jgi:hypothetical protein
MPIAIPLVCLMILVLQAPSNLAAPDEGAAAQTSPLAEYYGFLPIELYKIDPGIANLIAKDLNGDGKTDLAVMNHTKARIELLLQRPAGATTPASETGAGPNEIASDRRLEQKNIPVSKQLVGLAAGDFDADGRCDLAYYGTPGELIVLLQDAKGGWSRRRSFDIADGSPAAWTLDAGDVNGDKLDDLLLIGATDLYVLYNHKGDGGEGGLAEPVKFPFSGPNMSLLRIVDFDGDGRNDVTYTSDGDEDTLRVRYQLAGGELGPEVRYGPPPLRALAFADVDNKPGSEFLSIDRQSGRLMIHGLADASDTDSPVGSLQFHSLGKLGSNRTRGLAIGDFDGDGDQDVVVSDPQGAQLIWFVQQGGGLGAGRPFPAMAGSGELRTLSSAKGEADELLVLSVAEKTIGHSRVENDRFVFPQPLAVVGEPLAIDVADIDGDGRADLGYAARRREGATGKDQLVVRWLRRTGDGWQLGKWGDAEEVVLAGTTNPSGLRLVDANHDGRIDWLVFNASGPTQVLLADAAGKPVPSASAGTGLAASLDPGAVFTGDLDGPTILVSQHNFTRDMAIGADGRWRARDQFNAPNLNAKIAAAVPCDFDGDGEPELVLADLASKTLVIQKRSGTVFKPWKRVRLGAIDLKMLATADLNGDGKKDVVVVGSDSFAVGYTGATGRRLVERANYETTVRDAALRDLVAADLNNDGLVDIALVDTSRHFLDIVQVGRDGQVRPALAFQVFEAKSAGGREEGGVEPREIIAADVTGDGRNDLILIAHDRILVYPQDAGPADQKPPAEK